MKSEHRRWASKTTWVKAVDILASTAWDYNLPVDEFTLEQAPNSYDVLVRFRGKIIETALGSSQTVQAEMEAAGEDGAVIW